MVADYVPVCCQVKVTLDGIRSLLPRQFECRNRIFRRVIGGSPVRDDVQLFSLLLSGVPMTVQVSHPGIPRIQHAPEFLVFRSNR